MSAVQLMPLSITYCDLPIIESRTLTNSDGTHQLVEYSGILETLSVYFNKIWLPYPYGFTMDGPNIWTFFTDGKNAPTFESDLAATRSAFDAFYNKYRLLFDEGILETVPPTIIDQLPADFGPTIIKRLSGRGVGDLLSGDFTLAMHACYGAKTSPDFFPFSDLGGGGSKADTEKLVSGLSLGWSKYIVLFKYVLPRLPILNAEQVLELRKDVGNSRQRFADYLSELADEIEEHLVDGANPDWESIRKPFERLVMTQYQEYWRKLESKNSSLNYAVSAVNSVAQIDVTLWTPKFWYMLVPSFMPWSGASDDKLCADQQAFKFIYKLETKLAAQLLPA